jgi:hypothetical protein
MKKTAVLFAMLTIAVAAQQARAESFVVFNTAGGIAPSGEFFPDATATFRISGDQLIVDLKYRGVLSPMNVLIHNSETLNGVAFDTSSAVTLSPVSATASSVANDSIEPSLGVTPEDFGGAWIYDSSNPRAGQGMNVFSSVGADFGGDDNPTFGTPRIDPFNGINYGIIPNEPGPMDSYTISLNLNQGPQAQDTIRFILLITSGSLDLQDFENVSFYFGSEALPAIGSPDIMMPEPSSFTLLGMGCLCLVGYRWWTRKRKPAKTATAA